MYLRIKNNYLFFKKLLLELSWLGSSEHSPSDVTNREHSLKIFMFSKHEEDLNQFFILFHIGGKIRLFKFSTILSPLKHCILFKFFQIYSNL